MINELKKINDEFHYFTYIPQKLEKSNNGKLKGIYISIKDCICVKGMESRAGSNILKNYIPVFDATIVEKIKKEGGIIIGKTTQDSFGFGSFNVNSEIVPLNPLDKERVTGGSSGGAAGLTKILSLKKIRHIAIAESTGGSIACPSAYCGVYGLTPTYGKVSRYGLIDYANSLDKIGVMADNINDIELMLDIIAGYDEKDSTSVKTDFNPPKKRYNIAIIKESIENIDNDVKNNFLSYFKNKKYDIVNLPLTFKYGIQTYYLISLSEASTNLAKYCGMRYGYEETLKGDFNEYFSKVRSHAFSKEEKRRIILGTFARMSGFRDAYYLKALKIRTKIIEEYKELFKKYDIIATPSMPNIAPKFSEIKKLTPLENFMMDIMTVGPNLAGLPHLSIPYGTSKNMPTSVMLIADHFNDKYLIDFVK